jgi:hypothetical protein
MRFDPPNSVNDLYEQALAFTPFGRLKEAIPATHPGIINREFADAGKYPPHSRLPSTVLFS